MPDNTQSVPDARESVGSRKVERGGAVREAERERDAAEASRDRFAFLAEVSRCLADSLDYETTLATIAGMSLPYLGAWCVVDVLMPEGDIRRLAVLHPDPEKQGAARELHRRYQPRPEDLIGAPRVIRTGRAEMVFDVPDDAVVAAAQDEDHLALLRTLGIKAYVIAPMVARGRTLGAITFVTADASRRFGDIDVVIADDLARRAAMAVDNARLHREATEARNSAEAVQLELEAALDEAERVSEALREARDLSEAALKGQSDFIATMSHEIRTPLNAIVGYAELLELDVAGQLTDMQRTYVARLRQSSRHLLRLVDDVLDLEKTEAGRLSVEQQVESAADAIRAALAIVRPQATGKLVTLTNACEHVRGLRYLGDEHRVRQILVNLLGNAIKFSTPGGRVVIECSLHEERSGEDPPAGANGGRRWVLFRVRDAGRGVAAEDAEAIFEPFVQAQSGLTRSHEGSGLGLSISRRLARLMGGEVALEPAERGGSGATFTLRIPAAAAASEAELYPDGAPARHGVAASPVSAEDASAAQAERADARRALETASAALLRDMVRAIDEFIVRVREDPVLAVAAELTDLEVADHLSTLLTDIANSLGLLSESSGDPTELLADGIKIQRLIGELHGAQRQRLGWTEEQLVHEAEIVRSVCMAAIGRAIGGDGRATRSAEIALARLLEDRVRACLSGHRAAALRS